MIDFMRVVRWIRNMTLVFLLTVHSLPIKSKNCIRTNTDRSRFQVPWPIVHVISNDKSNIMQSFGWLNRKTVPKITLQLEELVLVW